jgi:hypothetical protein
MLKVLNLLKLLENLEQMKSIFSSKDLLSFVVSIETILELE